LLGNIFTNDYKNKRTKARKIKAKTQQQCHKGHHRWKKEPTKIHRDIPAQQTALVYKFTHYAYAVWPGTDLFLTSKRHSQ